MKIRYVLTIFIGISLLFPNARDCPINFSPKLETAPDNTPDCVPDNFLFSSSSNNSFYFIDTVTIDDMQISDEDWFAAFNCEE